jgi:putative transposase
MKKSKFNETQIFAILKEQEQGKPVNEICRAHGIRSVAFYNWKSKYAGMDIQELRRLKELESENFRLKRIVANQSLDIDLLRDLLSKK